MNDLVIRIGVDIDGTVANFVKSLVDWLNEKYKDHPEWRIVTEEEVDDWNYVFPLGLTFLSLLDESQQDWDMITKMKPYPDAVEIVQKMIDDKRYEVMFNTSRYPHDITVAGTIAWLEDHFDFCYHEISGSMCKQMMCEVEIIFTELIGGKQNLDAEILIDDYPPNLADFAYKNPYGMGMRKGILVCRPWNEEFRKFTKSPATYYNTMERKFFPLTFWMKDWKEIGAFFEIGL